LDVSGHGIRHHDPSRGADEREPPRHPGGRAGRRAVGFRGGIRRRRRAAGPSLVLQPALPIAPTSAGAPPRTT
jgi:hypothetical protein